MNLVYYIYICIHTNGVFSGIVRMHLYRYVCICNVHADVCFLLDKQFRRLLCAHVDRKEKILLLT